MTSELHIVSDARSRSVRVPDPRGTLADLLSANGFPLNTRCNQRGLCRGCSVHIASGAFIESGERRTVLPGEGVEVLACQCRASAGETLEIRIPPKSSLAHPPAVVSDFLTRVPTGCDPIFSGWKTRPLGVAVDIGTTTVALLLAELDSGRVLARASALNAQVRHGDNVLTRIHLCQSDPANVAVLRDAFWHDTFRPLFRDLISRSGADPARIAGVCVAGNTTMLHLAAGEDPTPLGVVPFAPKFLEARVLGGAIAGLEPDAEIHLLPGISAYVGADITAGIACCAAQYGDRPRLFVDVGTNGEIFLSGPSGNLACATAAGPAFEGCGLTCGMRAADGVIGTLRLATDPFGLGKIGGPNETAPHGIAGSAYVDFLFEGRQVGLLESSGRFNKEYVAKYPDRFQRENNHLGLLLAVEHPHLRITEVDVALLLQAKSAVAAGILTLLSRQGLAPGDIGKVFLAGGFGLHLSLPHAIGCGLLPGFEPEQIEAVGNTSLGGAFLAMLDRSLAAEMDALRHGVETVELNLDPGFEDRFLDHLSLP